jgi:hypothetical protein
VIGGIGIYEGKPTAEGVNEGDYSVLDVQLQYNERQQERSREEEVLEKCLGKQQSQGVRQRHTDNIKISVR